MGLAEVTKEPPKEPTLEELYELNKKGFEFVVEDGQITRWCRYARENF